MSKRSGEAMAALGRKAGPMRHRLAGRGGARNELADIIESLETDDGYQMPYSDSSTLVPVCPEGCTHKGGTDCQIPYSGFDPNECPFLGIECTSMLRTGPRKHDHTECQKEAEVNLCHEQWDCMICLMNHPCDCFLPWNQEESWYEEDE